MDKYKECSTIIRKRSNDNSDSFLLKKLTPTMQYANSLNLQGLLEFLNTTNDINIQVKLFSTLSAYLISNSNNCDIDVIITCNAIYTKIHNVLAKGLPRKATEALNFLSTLLFIGDEETGTKRRTLALYGRNMSRVSGCLATMSDMFTNCMMYHDTWNALCRCLAVACSDSKLNQSYCTHLVPVCIKRCNQSNIDIFQVLQSLLYNHERNIQLFLDTNGTAIFTRELLHYDSCMQLLATVVQSSTPAAAQIACKTNVSQYLRDFLRLYGPQSQIGLKAIVILNHIGLRIKGDCKKATTNESENLHTTFVNGVNHSVQPNIDDTTNLMQNVMTEVLNWNQNNDLGYVERSFSARNTKHDNDILFAKNPAKEGMWQQAGETFSTNRGRKSKILQADKCKELSFSFLQNQNSLEFGKIYNCNKKQCVKKNNSNCKTNNENKPINNITNNILMQTNVNHQIETTDTCKPISEILDNDVQNISDLNEFKPTFASTPKKTNGEVNKIGLSQTHLCKSRYMSSIRQCKLQKPKGLGIHKPKRSQDQQTMEIKHRSISTRLFEAINESCTTVVNTVKSIFKTKVNNTQISKEPTSLRKSSYSENLLSSTYSFTNYMHKRDAALSKEWTKKENIGCEDFSIETSPCKTCSDTLVLKRKLSNDDYLKQTVKKLKLGINLYGCDFKKISKTMWLRENYMTPAVLYNIYRKLIVK